MNAELSDNTKSILLLTAPLIVGEGKAAIRPLGTAEYSRLAQQLREHNQQPADLLQPGAADLLRDLRPDVDIARIGQLLERGFLLSQAVEYWKARAIWVISRADPDYPLRYKKRLGRLAPPVIYGCGSPDLLDFGGLAVIGSRNADDPALEYAENVGRLAAGARYPVISGGARGVDQAAMSAALTEGGTAIGVLSDKLERAALERDNRDVLLDERLVLISPYDPRAGFNAGNSMQRNKLVYALADAALVVESDYNKGGTWTGAAEQLDKLRSVPVYVRSVGEIGPGLKALQRKGAYPWPNPQTPDDFQGVLHNQPSPSEKGEPEQATLFPKSNAEVAVAPDQAESAPEPAALFPEPVEFDAPVEMSPGDALFDKVRQLLVSIDTPTTDYLVANYLEVSKSQANDWLKRLVREGKYQQLTKPTRYVRIE